MYIPQLQIIPKNANYHLIFSESSPFCWWRVFASMLMVVMVIEG